MDPITSGIEQLKRLKNFNAMLNIKNFGGYHKDELNEASNLVNFTQQEKELLSTFQPAELNDTGAVWTTENKLKKAGVQKTTTTKQPGKMVYRTYGYRGGVDLDANKIDDLWFDSVPFDTQDTAALKQVLQQLLYRLRS